jgi:nicotinate-nucleotide pyrophosphorylase (carboxylating)
MNHLLNNENLLLIKSALKEDIGAGDLTAQLIPKDKNIQAEIITREAVCICGIDFIYHCFNLYDPALEISFFAKDGDYLQAGSVIARVKGCARSILTVERTALNFLQTLSATATQAKAYVELTKHTNVTLLDTRKTIPNLRHAQKYAVKCAGASNHRFGLYDAYLIKENHIKACGGIDSAVSIARQLSSGQIIEIEVESLEELELAFIAKPDVVMLDNFTIDEIKKAVALNQNYNIKLEVSGGITLETIKEIAETGVDYISVGAMTKNIKAIDLTLLVKELE